MALLDTLTEAVDWLLAHTGDHYIEGEVAKLRGKLRAELGPLTEEDLAPVSDERGNPRDRVDAARRAAAAAQAQLAEAEAAYTASQGPQVPSPAPVAPVSTGLAPVSPPDDPGTPPPAAPGASVAPW